MVNAREATPGGLARELPRVVTGSCVATSRLDRRWRLQITTIGTCAPNTRRSLPHDRRSMDQRVSGIRDFISSRDGAGLPLPGNSLLLASRVCQLFVNSLIRCLRPALMASLASHGESWPPIPAEPYRRTWTVYALCRLSQRFVLHFEISRGPIDRVRADILVERRCELSWIDPTDPLSRRRRRLFFYPGDGISGRKGCLLTKGERANDQGPLRGRITLHFRRCARAGRITLSVQYRYVVADETFSVPGVHSVEPAELFVAGDVTVTITVDGAFSPRLPISAELGVQVA